MKHIYSLDGVRGFAVLIVLLSHSQNLGFLGGEFFQQTGKIGVYIFFILSSYLIFSQFKFNSSFTLSYVVKFYVKRVIRIYPLLVVVLTGIYVMNIVYPVGDEYTLKWLYNNVFLIKMTGVFWSIKVEMVFYLLAPILNKLFR